MHNVNETVLYGTHGICRIADIEERDFRDTHRQAAPLRQAEDAALLDTSALDFRQSLEALLEIIRERTGL